ncbi:MAG: Rrf2 family transcriptional regulator [Deltaproteobacteria bacterium]|nr:Rrf2 family transcriptional regulator [Deltaproteobacteria bacterium]
MKLSAKTRFAVKILLDLTIHDQDQPVSATLLSKHTGISVQFIEQILKNLKWAGVTKSVRGPKGGHCLAKKPDEITLAEVVVLMEGGLHLAPCTGETRSVCASRDFCSICAAWARVSTVLSDELTDISIQSLLDDYQQTVAKAGNVEIFPACCAKWL